MKKISKSNKGFTLVELLAVVVILGILLTVGIVAVTKLIDRAKNEQLKSQEQTLVMAAKNYLQENRAFLPKNIGETTTVSVKLLKNNKYITEDIINDKKESCMANTYVTAYKENTTKYVYKAHIYCGSDTPPITEVTAVPTVAVDFVDLSGNSIKNDESILEKVSEAKFVIDFTGGYNEGKEVPIDSYSYSILVQVGTTGSLQEVYNSGTISAGRSFTIHVDRDNNLIDYIDVTEATTVVIKATVRNTVGGVNSIVEFLGSDTTGAQVVYQDKTAPTCVTSQTIGEAAPNDWINLNTAVKERKVTVVCRDGSGSGCIRSSFTKTLSGAIEKEYDDIEIKDNAGNPGTCRVRVNFDRKKPRISIDAYARGKAENSISGNSILSNAPRTTDSNGVGTINEEDYTNLINGFMSKAKYPYGVIYKVTINDLSVRSWKWEVNEIEIESKNDSRYNVVRTDISEGKTVECDDDNDCNIIYVNLIDNGLRKGVLTVTDRAGNTSTFTMYAKIDRRAPGAPTILNSSNNKSTGDWTDASVHLTLTSNLNASSIENYYYTYNETASIVNRDGVTDEDADIKWVRFNGGAGKQTFTTETIWNKEMDKIVYVMVCDIMENCSESNSTLVRIDRTAPTGLTVRGFKKENADNVKAATGLEMIENNTWHNGWVLVVPRGASDTGSGDLSYLLTVTGASENIDDGLQGYRNINAEGISYVSFKACDKVGNCSSAVEFIVKLDRTGPTAPEIVNSSGGQWTKDSVTLTVRNSKDTGSTIGNYYYSYIENPVEYGTNPDTKWALIEDGKDKETFTMSWDEDINKHVYLKACDKVGNCSTVKNTTVQIDKTAPSKPTIYDEKEHAYVADWTNKNFSLVLKSDDAGSGLDDYQYTYSSSASAVGDDSSTQWVSNAGDFDLEKTKFTTTPFKLERNQNVYIRVCDKVGNCSTKASALIQIDKTPPTCSDGNISVNNSANGVTGEVTCIDSASHCVKDKYDYKNLKETTSVTIKDNAGNEKECSIDISPYDCSTSSWDLFWIYSKRQNSCPADTEQYDYDYGSCLAKDNYHIDACSVGCGEWCDPEARSCGYVCCIYRSKTTCYRH